MRSIDYYVRGNVPLARWNGEFFQYSLNKWNRIPDSSLLSTTPLRELSDIEFARRFGRAQHDFSAFVQEEGCAGRNAHLPKRTFEPPLPEQIRSNSPWAQKLVSNKTDAIVYGPARSELDDSSAKLGDEGEPKAKLPIAEAPVTEETKFREHHGISPNYLAAAALIPGTIFAWLSCLVYSEYRASGPQVIGYIIAVFLIAGLLALFVALVAQGFSKRGFKATFLPSLSLFLLLVTMVVNYSQSEGASYFF